ncbi:MAG: NADPH:quinone reductase [Rhodospirillales bacterium]
MKAVWYEGFGAADKVLVEGEKPDPEPASGEVLVRIAVSGVNPVDTKRRQGGRGDMPGEYVIPGFDGAGVIEAVGDGVNASRVGQRVWVFNAQFGRNFGTTAELCAVPAELAVPMADTVPYDAGACLGIPALTAHRCLFADGPLDGQIVLVTGGAGAVGNYAVQMAHICGARVIATVSGSEKAALASAAGAEHVVNYRTEDVAERIMEITGGAGVDRVVEVDFAANLATNIKILKVNGVISSYASDSNTTPAVPFYELVYKCITVHHVVVFLMPDYARKKAVANTADWVNGGRLTHHLGPRFPLVRAADAHAAVEGGAFGKVLIDVQSL